jgi:1-deoxy-D-xylulose-5-phosphate reductoisomerase
MQNVVILGSTGSIGCSTLAVIRQHPDKYRVIALTANTALDKLLAQCIEFKPEFAVILDKKLGAILQDKLAGYAITTQVLTDYADLSHLVALPATDIVMSAIVGSKGLQPTFMAISAGKKVLLANKEALVTGGKLIIEALKHSNAQLIPVDSEHSAIFQSLPDGNVSDPRVLSKIILTASGGPFRTLTQQQLAVVSSAQAIKHPNWSMGRKISVDCSTLMNKGLEVIEAYWLFGLPIDKIEVLVHPQSIIHSMVEYVDGSIIAQLGTADMKTPIAYALAYPQRINSGSARLDFTTLSSLTFEQPDYQRFPCLKLAFDAMRSGGIAPAVLNAANEVAVAAFLADQIGFYDINAIIQDTLDHFGSRNFTALEEIIEIDLLAKAYASSLF